MTLTPPKTTRTPAKPSTPRSRAAQSTPLPSSKSAKPAKSSRKPAPTELSSGSKQSQLVALLRSSAGATIAQMTAATGWQPHTVRGTISGVLRKRLGLDVQCADAVNGNARVYRIVGAVA